MHIKTDDTTLPHPFLTVFCLFGTLSYMYDISKSRS
jgi:hypothetical protein